MRQNVLRCNLAVIVIGIVLLVGGCSQPHYDDPVSVMIDTTEGHQFRWAAAKQAEREMFDSQMRIAALRDMVWQRGHPTNFRIYAVDELIEINEAQARNFFVKRLPSIMNDLTVEHIIELAVSGGWHEITPSLIRRYAIRMPPLRDENRLERKGIEALNPDRSVEEVVFNLFAGTEGGTVVQRAAAWQLLNRLKSREELVSMLADCQSDEPLLLDLQAAAIELGVTANNIQTITWIQVLRSPTHRNLWRRMAKIVAELDNEKRDGLDLRHLPVLLKLGENNDSLMEQSCEELLATLMRFTKNQRHFYKGPTYDGPMDEYPQQLAYWKDELSWADLLTMNVIVRTLRDREFVGELFKQADSDFADQRTEYGGLLRWNDNGKVIAKMYRPAMRRHDLIYYAPKSLIIDAYTSLAHYHFHAQKRKNQAFAGPGIGDMDRIARLQQFSAIVLTFIDEDHLNIDYYQPENVVVDLCTVRR